MSGQAGELLRGLLDLGPAGPAGPALSAEKVPRRRRRRARFDHCLRLVFDHCLRLVFDHFLTTSSPRVPRTPRRPAPPHRPHYHPHRRRRRRTHVSRCVRSARPGAGPLSTGGPRPPLVPPRRHGRGQDAGGVAASRDAPGRGPQKAGAAGAVRGGRREPPPPRPRNRPPGGDTGRARGAGRRRGPAGTVSGARGAGLDSDEAGAGAVSESRVGQDACRRQGDTDCWHPYWDGRCQVLRRDRTALCRQALIASRVRMLTGGGAGRLCVALLRPPHAQPPPAPRPPPPPAPLRPRRPAGRVGAVGGGAGVVERGPHSGVGPPSSLTSRFEHPV